MLPRRYLKRWYWLHLLQPCDIRMSPSIIWSFQKCKGTASKREMSLESFTICLETFDWKTGPSQPSANMKLSINEIPWNYSCKQMTTAYFCKRWRAFERYLLNWKSKLVIFVLRWQFSWLVPTFLATPVIDVIKLFLGGNLPICPQNKEIEKSLFWCLNLH